MVELSAETREAVAAARAGLPETVGGERVVFGFDGFVDRVRTVVEDRHGREAFETLDSLAELGARISDSAASNSSLSFEWLQDDLRTGGHTCHLARAYATLGFDPVMVGLYGDPVRDVFAEEFADVPMHSLGSPGSTDAVEFDDGKLMLTESGSGTTLDWARVRETVGVETLAEYLDGASLLGVGYVSWIPSLPSVVDGLREEVWPRLDDPPERVLFDPADVRRLDEDVVFAARDAVERLDAVVDVTVSANRFETKVLAEHYAGRSTESLRADAELVAANLDVTRYVGHGLHESVVVGDGTHAVRNPVTDDPALTTSSGDHFNAGFALGLLCGLDDAAAAVVGNALAGVFVRTGDPPRYDDVRDFVDDYEAKFE
ncbi:hypothetical protein EFA46_012900 (plasmid) [Halarchaeum sp. CBA1220]|uniref:PfkB family carbohydrate kinase n=1 Tax=Halarchaeum sp. CBA1220 TaxID=1853682 RepID=UPI000F3A88EF|nr:PfkB family carbohydrate kinase [Halarchaeum sp. CBA1220]QLC35148.1 hypothetical protein EFA46_012900 [Halarchaeum sp. CBA1220]